MKRRRVDGRCHHDSRWDRGRDPTKRWWPGIPFARDSDFVLPLNVWIVSPLLFSGGRKRTALGERARWTAPSTFRSRSSRARTGPLSSSYSSCCRVWYFLTSPLHDSSERISRLDVRGVGEVSTEFLDHAVVNGMKIHGKEQPSWFGN